MKSLLIAACLLSVCGCDSGTEHNEVAPGETRPALEERTKNYWAKPFQRMVVLGESTVGGGGYIQEKEYSLWVPVKGFSERRSQQWRRDLFADILARLISECQSTTLDYYNRGIPANVISPRSPGYSESLGQSALQRYRQDVIALKPDLFILCYGLNDMSAGMAVDEFAEDLETIVRDVNSECEPLIVLTTVFYMNAYRSNPPYNRGSIEASRRYNKVIRRLAEKYDCLLADVWEAEGQTDWLIQPDGIHANKVGSFVIAHRIFNTIARNCSGLSLEVNKHDRETKWSKNLIRKRLAAGDSYDPWWMSD